LPPFQKASCLYWSRFYIVPENRLT
jgi:hypothetical protein